MKKPLSLLLTFLLLFTLVFPALAEESESDSRTEISEDVSSDLGPAPASDAGEPEPEPESVLEPESEPVPDPEPEPNPMPEPDPVPETSAEDTVEMQPPPEFLPVVPEDMDIAGAGNLDASAYEITETPTGDIIIEEHSCIQTMDILGLPVDFNLDDLTMRSALVAVFGEYQHKTQAVSTYYDGQLLDTSTEYVPGLAGVDMEWIAGAVIFTVLLFCFMRFLGGVFK